jgi:acyl-CoA reductase-like NAD-dependent aldehyde dehydrogenase
MSAQSDKAAINTIPQLIAGKWQPAAESYDVRDPYRGTVIAKAPRSGMEDLERAMQAAHSAKHVMAAMPGYKRAELLRRVGDLLGKRVDQIAEVMARETGKAIKDCRAEVQIPGHDPALRGGSRTDRGRAGAA